ncbi:hypothetical protein [Asticcacaulis benevestitus]|uniref:hypothetical protein n=1 Tax=Asticcacaulis benevestitus TaxID=347481 RepID=UPI000AA602C1|nr:hypothetical protein [Asticcacaulis benevestitus]
MKLAAIVGHLCRRYILSRPPIQGSSRGRRSVSIIVMLIKPITTTPLNWTTISATAFLMLMAGSRIRPWQNQSPRKHIN